MKPRYVLVPAVAFVALAASSLAQSQSQSPSRPKADDARFRATVATQKAINRYFHSAVMPKLKPCWGRVQGKGTVVVKYLYADNGKGGWSFQSIAGSRSDLPKGQEKAAVDCMQQAARGTSFPKEKTDKGKSYLIGWAWPVPLPPDADQQVARMLGSNGGEGGGCDGRGAEALCLTCAGRDCPWVCVGYNECTQQATKPGGFDSICTVGGQCASGGPFGLAGRLSIY